jgi:hypothetical protein
MGEQRRSRGRLDGTDDCVAELCYPCALCRLRVLCRHQRRALLWRLGERFQGTLSFRREAGAYSVLRDATAALHRQRFQVHGPRTCLKRAIFKDGRCTMPRPELPIPYRESS